MSYSAQDIEEALVCALKESPDEAGRRVFDHLDGSCSCDANRCSFCGVRPRNKITYHTDDCPMKLRS